MATNFCELCTRFQDENVAIRFLQERGILHQEGPCTLGDAMNLTREGNGVALRWRCHNAQCRTEVSVRMGTWPKAGLQDGYSPDTLLEQRLLLNKILLRGDRPEHEVCSGLEEAREVVAESLLSNPLVTGGPDCTVEAVPKAIEVKRHNLMLQPEMTVATLKARLQFFIGLQFNQLFLQICLYFVSV
ncbi:hypothetical protein M514_27426 [Trichuris suis]|uniref:Uncharacterized protein n=1 Tax=Trichuris suis TaxID=68888 RepID=A0A085MT34_9BILA|nr:hypothetical protein M514_27426 [Trichuris suis]